MCRCNAKAKALFEGSNTSGDASKDDFSLLLFLNSFTHGNAEMMKEIFYNQLLTELMTKVKEEQKKAILDI